MHINSSPACVCNGCMQLRLVKSNAWLDAWSESYLNEPNLPYKGRVLLVDTVMALRSLVVDTVSGARAVPRPQEGHPQITPPSAPVIVGSGPADCGTRSGALPGSEAGREET